MAIKKYSLILFSLIFSICFQSLAQQDVVNVYSWSSYISPKTIRDFENRYKIKINYDVYDSNEVLDAKLMAGNTGYDLVFPSDNPFLKNHIKLGIYQKLDKKLLPNYKNIDSFFLNMMSTEDPGNQYAIPWLWGLTGIAFDTKKLQSIDKDLPTDSLELIFNPEHAKKLSKCGINFLDSPTEIFPIALLYNGFDPNTHNIKHFEKAFKTLKNIRPYIRSFNSSSYDDLLVDGSACVSISWSGDIAKANEKLKALKSSKKFKFVLPKEGFHMGIDSMAIPHDSQNKKNTYKFINFLMDPKVAAENSNYTKYFNANKASYKYIDPDLISTRPSNKLISSGHRINPYPPKLLRKVNRLWMKFITDN